MFTATPRKEFRLDYEGLHSPGGFTTVTAFEKDGHWLVVATDESDIHQNTSVTNRIERVMYLAWEKLGKPDNCVFAEHYRAVPTMRGPTLDVVEFEHGKDGQMLTHDCWACGKTVGLQFQCPKWTNFRVWSNVQPQQRWLMEVEEFYGL